MISRDRQQEGAAGMDMEGRAEKAEEAGDLEAALGLWRELAIRDRDAVFFCHFGRVAQELERWEEAENAFAQALRLDAGLYLAMESMGDLWATRTDKSDAESFGKAKEWFLAALKHERSARVLTFLGNINVALDDPNAARHAFQEAIQLDPDFEEALYNLAVLDEKMNPERSMELLDRAIQIDPDYLMAHQALGRLLQKAKDLARAEYHFRRCLEIDPTDYWSLLYLANALAVQGKSKEAEQSYLLATTLYPERKEGAQFFARFLESIGKTQEAAVIRHRESSP